MNVALWGAAVSMVVAGALWFSGTKYLPTDTKAIETADGGASTKNLSIPNRNPISVRCRFRYEEDKIRIGLGENRRWKTKSSPRSSRKTAGTQYIPAAFQVWLIYVME
jgi:hypothetical protein